MDDVRDSSQLIEHLLGFGNGFRSGQISKSRNRRPGAVIGVAEVNTLLGNCIPTSHAVLGDLGDAAEIVVRIGVDVVVGRADLGRDAGLAAEHVVSRRRIPRRPSGR
jgi:hypothetical protein